MDIELVPIPLFIAFFGSIVYIATVIGDICTRRKVLEIRMSSDVADAIPSDDWKEPSVRSALRWGGVIVALGAGIFLVDLFPIGFESPIAYVVLLLATGTALLSYYFIERDNPDVVNGQSDASSPNRSDRRLNRCTILSCSPVHSPLAGLKVRFCVARAAHGGHGDLSVRGEGL